MMKLRIFSLVLALAACVPFVAFAESIIDIEGVDATTIGIYIKDLASGEVVVDHNSSLAMTPASVTKALTTATALATLGPDFCFTTTVELDGKRSATRGRWDGNLIINASGDPTVGSTEFKMTEGFTDSIVSGLRRLGITNIAGNIIIRESMSDAGPCPTWEVEDIAWPYGAGLFGFNYRGNTVRLYPNRGNTVPSSDLKSTVLKSPVDRTDVLRGVGSNDVTVWTIDKNRQNKAWNLVVTVPDPAEVYGGLLLARLKDAGINVAGRKYDETDARTSVYVNHSPSLKAICRNLMKRSDNLFAEGMLRALKPGETRAKCIKYEKEFWGEQGISTRYTIINDGSGLTRANRLSP
ncbi:MAG: D-alanyl-D-alanine carboxypeptidase/D-alanyl-D-alanine-endopeptidase, partial [Muribaculaceae bacterium]|nr:D-alanyl-D-alanine carboxypeptidase/D-alanyl-D-alanine-endopeptidase [Muribaculaceae bacterium]